MNKTAWIVLALALVAGFTILVMLYGALGLAIAVPGLIAFIFVIDRLYRRRSSRLLACMNPGEVLLASGLVSEGTYDEQSAVLVRDTSDHFRLLVSDRRGAAAVDSVTPTLTRHSNPYDQKSYIELNTTKGPMHFAPRKGFLVAGQAEYAQEVLDMVLGALPPSGSSMAPNPSLKRTGDAAPRA